MNMRGIWIGSAAMLAAALLSSCASTSLLTSWVDPEAAGKGIDNCMVIGVSNNAAVRRKFEDTFVAQLNGLGKTAIPSYRLLPKASEIDEQSVAPVVDRYGIDHLAIVRVVGKRTVTTHVPPSSAFGYPPYFPSYYGSWYGYYDYQLSAVSMPGYTYDTKYVSLETNVYDARSGKLIWSGLTETAIGSEVNARIQGLVRVLTAAMKKDKVL